MITCPVCEERVSLQDDYEPAHRHRPVHRRDGCLGRRRPAERRPPPRCCAARKRSRNMTSSSVITRGQARRPRHSPSSSGSAASAHGWTNRAPGMPWQRRPSGSHPRHSGGGRHRRRPGGPPAGPGARRVPPAVHQAPVPGDPGPLPGAHRPDLPPFLDGLTWVDLAYEGAGPARPARAGYNRREREPVTRIYR